MDSKITCVIAFLLCPVMLSTLTGDRLGNVSCRYVVYSDGDCCVPFGDFYCLKDHFPKCENGKLKCEPCPMNSFTKPLRLDDASGCQPSDKKDQPETTVKQPSTTDQPETTVKQPSTTGETSSVTIETACNTKAIGNPENAGTSAKNDNCSRMFFAGFFTCIFLIVIIVILVYCCRKRCKENETASTNVPSSGTVLSSSCDAVASPDSSTSINSGDRNQAVRNQAVTVTRQSPDSLENDTADGATEMSPLSTTGSP